MRNPLIPLRNSARAMVTDTTRAVLVLLFFPVDTLAASAQQTVHATEQRLAAYGASAQ